jgi:hypothetical protein
MCYEGFDKDVHPTLIMAFCGVDVFPISKLLCRCEKWPPPPPRLLYRTSHRDSAGSFDGEAFASASWRMRGDVFLRQWVNDEAEVHFSNHFNPENREPTMFLSTTSNLMRVLNIACRLHHEGREDIVITVIGLEAANLDAHNITHAEAIARLLGWPEPSKYRSEWLFLGRIKQTAIIKQVRYQDLLDRGVFDIFPALASNKKLSRVEQQIIQDFDVLDPSQCTLSKYVKDADHPLGAFVSQWNQSAEEGRADGRKCATFAALFDLKLPDEFPLAKALMSEALTWKHSIFYPDADYKQAFDNIVSLYLPASSADPDPASVPLME